MSSPGASATSADIRSTAALGGKADLSRRPAPGFERTTNSSEQDGREPGLADTRAVAQPVGALP